MARPAGDDPRQRPRLCRDVAAPSPLFRPHADHQDGLRTAGAREGQDRRLFDGARLDQRPGHRYRDRSRPRFFRTSFPRARPCWSGSSTTMSEPASAHTGALADLFVTNGMALFTSPGKSHGGRGFRQVSVLSEVTGGGRLPQHAMQSGLCNTNRHSRYPMPGIKIRRKK